MKAKNYSCLLFGFLWWVSTSCDLTDKTPERLFNVIALGSNKISSNFAREFKEIRTQNANGLLKVAAEDRKSFRSAVSCT